MLAEISKQAFMYFVQICYKSESTIFLLFIFFIKLHTIESTSHKIIVVIERKLFG